MKNIRIVVAAVLLVVLALFWQYFLKGYLLLPSVERFVSSFYEQYNSRVWSGQDIPRLQAKPSG